MRILTDSQYEIEAKPILQKIFVNGDPYSESFLPHITQKVILYPCHEILEIKVVNALVKAALTIGDVECYLSNLWEYDQYGSHCYILLSELFEFYTCSSEKAKLIDLQFNYSQEYVLYSGNAKWFLFVSHEYYGLLGGSSEFITTVKQAFPNLEQQVKDFLQNYHCMKAAGIALTLDWLPRLLTYVYGKEAAEKLLREAELL